MVKKESPLKDESLDEEVAEDAGQVAQEGNSAHSLHVPQEVDFFQPHGNDTGGTANDEHTATHTGAVGQQLPEDSIAGKVAGGSQWIHAHAASHERHVIDNA